MTLYIKALKRVYSDPEFLRFLLVNNLFTRYLQAARILTQYLDWYENHQIDLCLEKIFLLDRVVAILAEILSSYLLYIGKPKDKVKSIVKAFVDFATLSRAKAEYTYEQLISKTKGERAQLAAIQKILFHIGETLDFLKLFFEEPIEEIVNYILIRTRQSYALVDKLTLLSKKLKKLEESGEIEIEQPIEDVEIEIPKEVEQKLEKEVLEVATKTEKLTFSEKELKLLKILIEGGFIDRYILREAAEAKMGMPWSQIKKIATSINTKVIEKYGVPIIEVRDNGMMLVSGLFDRVKEQLRMDIPSLVALYEEKVKSSKQTK